MGHYQTHFPLLPEGVACEISEHVSFFSYNGVATAEGARFGLQKTTGLSLGVVASIVLVSPGMNLAEVCATCLRCQCGQHREPSL